MRLVEAEFQHANEMLVDLENRRQKELIEARLKVIELQQKAERAAEEHSQARERYNLARKRVEDAEQGRGGENLNEVGLADLRQYTERQAARLDKSEQALILAQKSLWIAKENLRILQKRCDREIEQAESEVQMRAQLLRQLRVSLRESAGTRDRPQEDRAANLEAKVDRLLREIAELRRELKRLFENQRREP
jgi:hypothetical protein